MLGLRCSGSRHLDNEAARSELPGSELKANLRCQSELFEKRSRPLEVGGLESLREAIIDVSEPIAGLISLPVVGHEPSQDHCCSQFEAKRGLLSCNGKCFRQAVDSCLALLLGRKNFGLDPQQVREIELRTAAIRVRYGSIDRQPRFLQL